MKKKLTWFKVKICVQRQKEKEYLTIMILYRESEKESLEHRYREKFYYNIFCDLQSEEIMGLNY